MEDTGSNPNEDYLGIKKQAKIKFINSFAALLKDTNETMTPLIMARNDIAKTLITLSSAILALTITAASGIFGKYLHADKSLYLIATWFMLMLTILLCLSSLWLSMNIVRMIIQLKNEMFDYIEDIESVVDKDKTDLYQVLKKRNIPFANAEKYNKWAHYLLRVGFLSFFASLIIFLIIGWSSFSSISPVATSSAMSSPEGKSGCCRPCNR